MDGELVVLDDDGRSNFPRLMFGRTGTHHYAFDLLMLEHIRNQAKQAAIATLEQPIETIAFETESPPKSPQSELGNESVLN